MARLLSRLTRTYRRILTSAQTTTTYASSAARARVAPDTTSRTGLTLSEACQILNVRPPQHGKADMSIVWQRFTRLFDVNEPENGGSLYLQSKVLRARQRIEEEVAKAQEKAEREEELQRGWRPKLFR